MSPPYRAGEFVWCRFPFSEKPTKPGGSNHISYVFAVTERGGRHYVVAAIYTTSQPWPAEVPIPPGVIPITEKQSKGLNQKAFVVDGRRVAFMPATEDFFPYLTQSDRGVQAVAPAGLRKKIEAEMARLVNRPDLIEVLGPHRPDTGPKGDKQ